MENFNKRYSKYDDGAYSKFLNNPKLTNKKYLNNLTDELNISKNYNIDNSFISDFTTKYKKKFDKFPQSQNESFLRNDINEERNKNPILIPRDLISQNFVFEGLYKKQTDEKNYNLPMHINSISITSKNKRSQVYSCDFNSYIIGQKKLKRNLSSESSTTYYNEKRRNTSDYSNEESAYKERKTISVDNSNTETSKNSLNNSDERNIIINENILKNYKNKKLQNSYTYSRKNIPYFSEDFMLKNENQNIFIENISNKKQEINTKRTRKKNFKCSNNENEVLNNMVLGELSFKNKEITSKSPKERHSITSMNSNNLKIEQLYISTDPNNDNGNFKMSNKYSINPDLINDSDNKLIENKNNEKEIEFKNNMIEKIENFNKFNQTMKEHNSKMHLVVLNQLLKINNGFSDKIKNYVFPKICKNFLEDNENYDIFTDETFLVTKNNLLNISPREGNNPPIKLHQISNFYEIQENEIKQKNESILVEKFKNISFKRPCDVIENYNYSMFSFEIQDSLKKLNEEENINPSFNGILRALFKFPFLIYRIFKTSFINFNGYYEIALFLNNRWNIIYIDDFLPYDNENKKIFGLSMDKNNLFKFYFP